MLNFIRIVRDCKVTFKRCLSKRPSWCSQRELPSLSTNSVELANEGNGEHGHLREAGDGGHCGRDGAKLYPNRIGGGGSETGGRRTRRRVKLC